MAEEAYYVGVDVAKETLDVAGSDAGAIHIVRGHPKAAREGQVKTGHLR